MTATYDLSTDIGKIRLIISDKDIADCHFTDEELQVFLDSEGSVNLASAAALDSWAAAYALNADSEHIGDYSYSQKITDKMLNLATRLRAADAAVSALTWAEPDLLGTDEGDT